MSQINTSGVDNLGQWNPENESFWNSTGEAIANRNLWISVPCLFLAFAIWVIWSAVTVNLNNIGFHFTEAQLFTLAAIPGLAGAVLRIIYSFVVPIFGGRNWTVLSTASLLIPTIWLSHVLQDPTTSYQTMLILAACCGLGGGNFASSMANISFFFPKKNQGAILGINAGLGNLGVSGLQFIAPLVIGVGIFGNWGGHPQTWTNGVLVKQVWLQNIGYIWVIPIIFFTLTAFFGMNNLKIAKTSLKDQFVIFKRKHMYICTWLYTMSFGSFIGFSVAFPLLIKLVFTSINPLTYAFIGPLLGALARSVGGWLADKIGGAVITFWSVVAMIAEVIGIIYFIQPASKNFWGFLIVFLILFITTGIANASIFRMIGVIFSLKEKAPALGFSAAIAAFGAFFIPKMFGWSVQTSGTVDMALLIFIGYYLISMLAIWWWYFRKNAEIKC